MGWYYTTGANKQNIINELTEDGKSNPKGFYRKCLAHSVRGNELYSVWTYFDQDKQEVDINKRWIGVDLLTSHNGDWGYKPLEESVHPYYYRCPLKFLKIVPTVACQEWRDEVMKNYKQKAIAV